MANCNSCAHNSSAGEEVKGVGVYAPSLQKVVTIREVLDRRIEAARKHVEDLCITKAKLEALNVLDHDVDLYQNILF